jgi:cytochrome c oxidase subunit 2
MLFFIALPSLKTLYIIEENFSPIITIKTIGYQWHWGYEYSEIENLKFDRIIIKNNLIRLLNTSNHLVIPIITPTQILISSKDVIHSWTIPSLGVKVDAIPGRINQCLIIINRPSIIVGQCSEICGAGHSFIPIILESPSIKLFKDNLLG